MLVTTDLIGIRRNVRDAVAERCQAEYKLPPERLLLNASHTHCGPEYRPRAGREQEAERYQAFLEQSLVQIVGQALERLAPASVAYARGRCGFAMNRRRPSERGYINRPEYDGPVDHAVPVLCVHDADKKLVAVAFGYACHNTTLSSVTLPPEEPRYMFNGDYAGFAQRALQQAYPDAVAMFVNGCSGDQNPYPRNGEVPGKLPLELAEHHGKTLAYSVVAAMLAGSRPLTGSIDAAFGEVELTRNNDKPTHIYPVQVIRLGDLLTLVALGSETVVDYSLRLKSEIESPAVWVAGYSNDYSGYIPSRRVAVEGGYEAAERLHARRRRTDRRQGARVWSMPPPQTKPRLQTPPRRSLKLRNPEAVCARRRANELAFDNPLAGIPLAVDPTVFAHLIRFARHALRLLAARPGPGRRSECRCRRTERATVGFSLCLADGDADRRRLRRHRPPPRGV